MGKLTTITIQTSSLLILQSRNSRRGWCLVCDAEREMIALDPNFAVTDLSWRFLEQWLRQCGMHWSEDDDGTSWLCFGALVTRVPNTNTGNYLIRR